MNRRIAVAFGAVGALLLGPAASAAPVAPAPAAEYELESGTDRILDHGQDDGGQGDKGQDDHDHDGDGRPDHDPEDHDEDDESKPKDDD